MIKKIKIFIASSIDELKTDRIEIGDFFRQLNEIYIDKGIHFSLIKCEDYDNAIAANGKQSEYDEEIRDSALSFFLFYKKIGDYTKHEFEVALESFRQKNSPKIVTFFKYLPEGEKAENDIIEFMQMLDSRLNHYYNTYRHIDSLKLDIYLQIKVMRLDEAEAEVKNGKIMLDGETLANCDNIPMFSKNKELHTLKKRLEELSLKAEKLKKTCADDVAQYNEYLKVKESRKQVEDKIKEIESTTIAVAEKIQEGVVKGSLSARQKEGYRLFEKGDINAALKVLDKDEILKDIEQNSSDAEKSIDKLQQNVNEFIQRVEFLSVSGTTAQKKEEMAELYKKAVELTVQFNLDKGILLDYVNFLIEQQELQTALLWAEKAELYVKLEEADGYKIGDLYDMLAMLYEGQGMAEKAERYFIKSNETYTRFLKDGDLRVKSLLASNILNFANFYYRKNNVKKAIDLCEEAKTIFKEVMDEKNISHYKKNYATALLNLSSFYESVGDVEKAKKNNYDATNIFVDLFDVNREQILPLIASAKLNLSVLLKNQKDNEGASEKIKQAVEYLEILTDMDPKAHEITLAKAYLNMATMIDAPTKAKIEIHEKAHAIYKKYYGKNPTAYAEEMAGSYKNLSALKEENGEIDQMVSLMSRAIKVLSSHIDARPELMPILARTHHGLGNRLTCNDRLKLAVPQYQKAIKLYTELAKNNEKYKPLYDNVKKEYDTVRLALEQNAPINVEGKVVNAGKQNQQNKNNQNKQNQNNQNNQNNQKKQNQNKSFKNTKPNPKADGKLEEGYNLEKEGKLNEALMAYHEATNMFLSMGADGATRALLCCYQITGIYIRCNDAAASIQYIEKAVEICGAFEKTIPDVDKAMIYHRYAEVLDDMKKYGEAQDYCLKAIKLREVFNKKEPGKFDYDLAEVYALGSAIMIRIGDYKYAAMGLATAMNLYQKDFNRGNKKALSGVATCYENLTVIYQATKMYNDAVKSAELAIEKWAWLMENVEIWYKNRLIPVFNKLVEIKKQTSSRMDEIERTYLMLAAIYERIAPKNPEVLYPELASCYVSLSNMFPGIFARKKSKEYIAKAVSVYEKLAEFTPKYNDELNKLREKL